jgi:hypothetical protein
MVRRGLVEEGSGLGFEEMSNGQTTKRDSIDSEEAG